MVNRLHFKKWELALMVAGAFLFSTSGYLLFTDATIKLGWFGLDQDSEQNKIAVLEEQVGVIKRKLSSESVFRSVPVTTKLFNGDTVLTGKQSNSTIAFEDGSTVRLSENTMMVLSTVSELGFKGIKRVPKVQVVTGNLTGTAKNGKLIIKTDQGEINLTDGKSESINVVNPDSLLQEDEYKNLLPRASKVIDLKVITPKDRTLLKIPDGSKVAEYSVNFKWKVSPPVPLELEFMMKKGKEFEPLAKRTITPTPEGVGSLKVILKNPGWYFWKLSRPRNTEDDLSLEPVSNLFALSSKITAIQTMPVQYGGREFATNENAEGADSEFKVKIRWQPWNDIEDYKVKIMTAEKNGDVVSEENVDQTSFETFKGKVISKPYFYQVSSTLKNGFEIVSEAFPIQFNFLPPSPLSPPPRIRIHLALPSSPDLKIPFHWTKTAFTDSYVFELSKDPDFNQVLLQKTVSNNGFVLSVPRPGSFWWIHADTRWWKQIGTYYWRVQSIGQGGITSNPSEIRSLDIVN